MLDIVGVEIKVGCYILYGASSFDGLSIAQVVGFTDSGKVRVRKYKESGEYPEENSSIEHLIENCFITVDNYRDFAKLDRTSVLTYGDRAYVMTDRLISESASGLICDYVFDGKRMGASPEFVDRQGVDQKTLDKIGYYHRVRYVMKKLMEVSPIEDVRALFKAWHELEFELQELWGFPKDISYHAFWRMPRCSCPIMDNEDLLMPGTIMSGGCDVHGPEVDALIASRKS